jgi:hypothetical protein
MAYGDWTCPGCLISTPVHYFNEGKGAIHHPTCRIHANPVFVTRVTDESLINKNYSQLGNTMAEQKTLKQVGEELTAALTKARTEWEAAQAKIKADLTAAMDSPEWKQAMENLSKISDSLKTAGLIHAEPGQDCPKCKQENDELKVKLDLKGREEILARLRAFDLATKGWKCTGEELLEYYVRTVHLSRNWTYDSHRVLQLDKVPGMEIVSFSLKKVGPGTVVMQNGFIYIVTSDEPADVDGWAKYTSRNFSLPSRMKLRFDVVGL